MSLFFFFNDTATTEIYTLSLHDALPIYLAACAARGIAVGNTPGVLTDATADLTIALLLAAARRLPEGMAEVRDGRWGPWDPRHLLGLDLAGADRKSVV